MVFYLTYHLIKNPDRLDAELLNVGNIFHYRFTSQLFSRNTSLIAPEAIIREFPSRSFSQFALNKPF